jgi:MYXO-CTERM domain-containing protein
VVSSGGAAGGSGTAPTQGGCGCHTGGSDAHPGATASLVLLLVVGGRLRRRNSRGP